MAAWQAPRTAGMACAALYAGRIGGSGDTCAVILPATREILVSVAASGADMAVRSAIMCGRHGLGCFGDGPFGCLPVVPGASLPANCNQVRRARIGKVLALAVALSAPLCMTAISDLRLLALLLSCTDLYGTRQTAATCATPGGLDLRAMECGKYLLYLIGMILLKTQCQK